MKNRYRNLGSALKMIMIAALAFILLIGCVGEELPDTVGDEDTSDTGEIVDVEQIVFDKGLYRPNQDALTEQVKQWIEYSRTIPAVQETIIEGNRYLLITAGSKPTPGYGVQAEEVVPLDGVLEVRVVFTEPNEDDILPQVTTYPFDLVILEDSNTPLQFVNVNDPDFYFMTLYGKETIERPFIASNEWIHLHSPVADQEVEDSIYVSGMANVFEGTVNYELLADAETVIDAGYMQATMGSWGYFEQQIRVPGDFNGERVTLAIYSESPKDGSKLFLIEIPLKIKK